MKRIILSCAAAALFSISGVQAQYGWTYHENAGNPGGINTESDAPGLGTWTNIHAGGTATNTWSATVAIPFTFKFFGADVTHLKASTNGIITFDTLAASTFALNNQALPTDSLPPMSIACFWDQFTAAAPTGSGDDIRYNVFGTAPNRQLWIKWYSFEIGDPSISFVYMAAVLEESSNNIYIVDQYSTSGATVTAMDATVGLQASTTQYIQAGGGFVDVQGNGSSNTDNDYYQFLYLDSLDGALTQITNPSGALCAGTYNVEIELFNQGQTTIDSVSLDVIINGGTPIPLSYGGLSLVSLGTDTLSLGAMTFSSGTVYDFEFYLTSVNGVTDNNQDNDSLMFENIMTGLSGNYTINAGLPSSGTNFQSFAEATSVINAFGICGPVLFDVDSGSYADSLYLGEILGSSATNTITFDGGDANDVMVTYDGAFTEATWLMDGASFVTLKNISITSTKSTSDAWGVMMQNNAHHLVFDSCRFIMPVGTTSDVQCLVASSSMTLETGEGNNSNYITVSNSYFEGGETGIHIEGNGDGTPTIGYTITNNIFRQHDDEAIEMDDTREVLIQGNNIDGFSGTTADGVYLSDVWDFNISGNYIHVPDYGIYMFDANDLFTPASQSIISNNMVISDTDYGIYLNDFESTGVFHNTLVGSPAMLINDQTNAMIKNNIFVGSGDFSFESTDALTATDTIDYNIYYSDFTNMFDIGVNVYVDLAAWQTAETAYNANSLQGMPIFVSSTDLHVLDTLANDHGDNSVGILTDFDGDARPASTTVDIGADEYTPVLNDVAAIAILSPSYEACEDSLQFVEVVIQNLGLNEQDSIPVVIKLIGTSTATYYDTIYSTISAFDADTFSFGPINSFGYGASLLQVYTEMAGDDNTANDTIADSLMVVTLPSAVSVMNDTLCSATDTAMLLAFGTASSVLWYETDTSSTPVFDGDTLFTTGAATYWVSQIDLTSTLVGAPSTAIGTAGNFTSYTAQYLLFEAYAAFTLDSVTVYPGDTGDVEILLQDAGGTTLETAIVSVAPPAAGDPVRVAVGFDVAPGSYRLAAGASTSTSGLMRNSSGASYPYEVSGVMSITGSSFNASSYYFYYNWRISTAGCESQRTMVQSVIDSLEMQLPADITLCVGESEVIQPVNLGYNYATYLWHDNSTDTLYTATTAGTVALTVTSAFGCERSDEMVVNNHPEVVVDLGADTTVCDGVDFDITLDAGPGFNLYLWSNAGQGQTITVDYAGTFTVSVTDGNGCEGTDEVSIFINPPVVADAGPDTLICQDSVFTFPNIGTWTDISGNVVTSTSTAGLYILEVSDSIGCTGTDTMEVTTKDCTIGISNIEGTAYNVYPNPGKGLVVVEFASQLGDVKMDVFDGLGNLVYSGEMSNSNRKVIDLTHLAKGYYLLKLSTDREQAITRIIVQ